MLRGKPGEQSLQGLLVLRVTLVHQLQNNRGDVRDDVLRFNLLSQRRDLRVKAAVVLAGTAQSYPSGRFDFAKAPPLLIVHGSADPLVPFARAEDAFNVARGPKGLLRIEGGGHLAPTSPDAYAATTDFFEAYDGFVRRRLRCLIIGRYARGHWQGTLGNALFDALNLTCLVRLANPDPSPAAKPLPSSGDSGGSRMR